jgi:hypothetical protein
VAGDKFASRSCLKALLPPLRGRNVTSRAVARSSRSARVSLTVRPQVFPGVSVLAGPGSELERLTGLRATVFVGSDPCVVQCDQHDRPERVRRQLQRAGPGLDNAMLLSDRVAIILDVEAVLQSDTSTS